MTLSVRELRGAGVGLCLGLAALTSSFALTQPAQARVDVGIGVFVPVAPPAPRYEVQPPRPHYYHADRVVWVPGHWRWTGHRYRWVDGHYAERPERMTRYEQGRWEQSHDGWRWHDGDWR